jgi:transcriptional regulator with XRE-family HTH domain
VAPDPRHPLRRARHRARLTGAQLAAKSGVSARAIHAIEMRKTRPRQDVKRRLCRALGVQWSERDGIFPREERR